MATAEFLLKTVDWLVKLRSGVLRNPKDWPIIAAVLRTLEQFMAPPGSWACLSMKSTGL